MEKQGTIHIHGLLAVVRQELDEHDKIPEGAFQAYDENGVHHRSVHRRKGEHAEAIWLLIDGIQETIAETPREVEPPTP